jgi:hypothetical protein
MIDEAVEPVTVWVDVTAVPAAGSLPPPPRTQVAGAVTVRALAPVLVQVEGRSMNALLPGPGSSWALLEVVPDSVEFGPVGS